ncbi:hypothetical protein AB0N89_15090 [Amycolatopsis sp. NPDC089917]|uniref:hypothetical protein n=1 Tax=Amycolatopsis sp. NPDC089917 TaxID=3155187 RepID=UPI003433DD2C
MSYWAIVSRNHPLSDPWTVVRGTRSSEESLTVDRTWRKSDQIYRIDSGREYQDYLPVTEEYVEWFKAKMAERTGRRRAAEPKWGPEFYYWAIVLGRFTLDDPMTVVRADGYGDGLHEFTRDLDWRPGKPDRFTRLMGDRGPGNDAVLITGKEARRFERTQADRVREHRF